MRITLLAVILAAAILSVWTGVASATPGRHQLVTCVASSNPVESTIEGPATIVTRENVRYTEKVDVEKIHERIRIYAPSRRCAYRGPFTWIAEAITYRTEISLPEVYSGRDGVVVEKITERRTVFNGHSISTTESHSSTTREESGLETVDNAHAPTDHPLG